jgi:hypothetical protein
MYDFALHPIRHGFGVWYGMALYLMDEPKQFKLTFHFSFLDAQLTVTVHVNAIICSGKHFFFTINCFLKDINSLLYIHY